MAVRGRAVQEVLPKGCLERLAKLLAAVVLTEKLENNLSVRYKIRNRIAVEATEH